MTVGAVIKVKAVKVNDRNACLHTVGFELFLIIASVIDIREDIFIHIFVI